MELPNTDRFITSTKGDNISDLPSDKINPSIDEIHIIDELYGQNPTAMDNLIREGKDVFIIGILFIILNLTPTNTIINKILPITKNSDYFLVFFKALIIMVLYWLIKHYYLSRKKK